MTSEPLGDFLTKLCSGDEAAAAQAFLKYEPFLRKAVRRHLPPPLQAKFDSGDIVQSVWGDVLTGFRDAGWRFASVAHLRAFLLKATHNRFIDRLRQHRQAMSGAERALPEEVEAAPSAQPRPGEAAEAEDLWEQMLHLCPPEHHEMLWLKRQGHTLAEIAARTGLHGDSVRRILRTLARQLAFAQRV